MKVEIRYGILLCRIGSERSKNGLKEVLSLLTHPNNVVLLRRYIPYYRKLALHEIKANCIHSRYFKSH